MILPQLLWYSLSYLLFQLENGFIQYMCVFGTTSRPAQLVNSTAVMCDGQVRTCDCVMSPVIMRLISFSPLYSQQVSLSPGISGRENTTFQLMLRNGSNVYTLDTSTGGNVFGEYMNN